MYRYKSVAAAIGKPSEMVLEFAYNYRHSKVYSCYQGE